jgi:hypothetical protein
MLRKNQRPSSSTSWQEQQLKRVNQSLRKLNREARRELRRIKNTGLTHTQYREGGNLFGTIATRMIGALQFHHEILKAQQEPQLFRLNVRFVTPCVHMSTAPKVRQHTGHGDDEAECEALKLEPSHQAEIMSLLELINSIEGPVSRRSRLRGAPLNAFFRGLNRFRLAALEQREHLLATSPRPKLRFELQVADGPDICTDCLKSKEIDVTMEGHDRQV